MKITATFFGKKKHYHNAIYQKITEQAKITSHSILIYIVLTIIVILTIVILGHMKISPKIVYFASNFRQAEENHWQLKDVFSMYALFNESNYIYHKKEMTDVIEAVNENKNEYDIIDMAASSINAQEVFSKTQKAVVTDETKTLQRISIGNMKILNYSSNRHIDFDQILSGNINLTKLSDKILLYNTHTSESYTNSDQYQFTYDGIMRSRNAEFNMLAIAKELSENLNAKGINTVQNTTPHDYGTYTSAYAKSRITIKEALNNMQSAGIIIDVHRDAASDLGFRPVANVKGIQTSQLMFVMGIGSDTTRNPYYEDNLRLAIKIQQIADEIYPGLFRPMMIRDSVYNQDMNKFSLLVEVGATGNTIEEAKLATRCLSNLLNIIYKD